MFTLARPLVCTVLVRGGALALISAVAAVGCSNANGESPAMDASALRGGVTISSPANGATGLSSPVKVSARVSSRICNGGLNHMQVLVNGSEKYADPNGNCSISIGVDAPSGSDKITVQAIAWNGQLMAQSSVQVTVTSDGSQDAGPGTPDAGGAESGGGEAGGASPDAGASAETGSTAPLPWPPPLPSGAVDYYVSPSGSDSADGSAGHPWLTIAQAANTISGGGQPVTVHVAPGTYTLDSSHCVASYASGSASAPITFVCAQRGQCKIDGNGACTLIWFQKGDYTRIWGFDFTGIQSAPSDCTGSGGSSVIGVESTNGHVDIGYNVIHDLPWGFATAAYVEPWGNGGYTGAPADVHDNVFHDIGWPAGAPSSCGPENNYALYIASGPDSHVYNNLIYDVGSIGIHCWHAANGMHIFNNTIANTSMGMLVGTGDGGYTVGAYYEVANNIVVNSHYGIYAEANAPGTLSTSSVFENNLVFGNDIDWGYDDHGTDTTLQAAGMAVTGTIAANPMFVSPSSGNYRLSAGSPAIAAGISQGAPDHDLDGYRRPFGAWFDIGAYESH